MNNKSLFHLPRYRHLSFRLARKTGATAFMEELPLELTAERVFWSHAGSLHLEVTNTLLDKSSTCFEYALFSSAHAYFSP